MWVTGPGCTRCTAVAALSRAARDAASGGRSTVPGSRGCARRSARRAGSRPPSGTSRCSGCARAAQRRPAMHIPDGFLSPEVALATGAVAAGGVALAVRRTERTLDERRIPLLGVTAAFVFAAQMLNFPIAGGTSGHVIGGALAVAVLGPWAAIVALSVVVGVQALLFADGGLTALGANLLNMAIIGPLVAAAV